jgi:hypothetical protein
MIYFSPIFLFLRALKRAFYIMHSFFLGPNHGFDSPSPNLTIIKRRSRYAIAYMCYTQAAAIMRAVVAAIVRAVIALMRAVEKGSEKARATREMTVSV